jgi:hypothetical protein
MLADPEMTIKEVAGVNRATIYRSLGLGSYAKGASSWRDETRGPAVEIINSRLGTPLFRMGRNGSFAGEGTAAVRGNW